MPTDPLRRCQFCHHWHQREPTRGECRAHPPTLVVTGYQGDVIHPTTLFPLTMVGQWCGEFKERRDGPRDAG